MKAAVQHEYGDPTRVFSVERVEVPAIETDEVLVQVAAAGVNWADWSMTMGTPYLMRLGYGLRAPRNGIRGTDVAGVVVEVGDGVDRFTVGDEVFGWCTGSFAEFAAVPADQLVATPPSASFEEAADGRMRGATGRQGRRQDRDW